MTNTKTAALIPTKAYFTTIISLICLINIAIIVIAQNDGTITPNVAAIAPGTPAILLPTNVARFTIIGPGVTSEIIFNDIKCKDKVMIDKQHLTETIKNRNFEILLTVGAGDICNYLPEIVKNVNLR